MVDVATLQIRVDTADLARGEASLEALQREGRQTETTFNRLGTTATRTGGAVRRVGGSAGAAGRQFQNAAFQVGDFATQMASGQRASVALAQQLPQLLGGFGVLGAVLGAVVAIGGALVPVLFNMRDGARSAGEAVADLEDATSNLNRAMRAFSSEGLQDAVEKYGELNEEILLLLQRQQKLAEGEALRKAAAAVAAFREEFSGGFFGSERESLAELLGVEATVVQIDNFGNKIRTINPQVQELRRALTDMSTAEGFAAQADAAARVLTILDGTEAESSDIYRNILEAEAALRALVQTSQEGQGPLTVFAEIAATIRDRFVEAVEAASKLPGPGGPESSPRPRARPIDWVGGDDNSPAGGGGRSAADMFASRLKALQNSLRSQRQIIDDWYAESQEILANRRAMEILGEQEHKAALLNVEREYQERLADLRRQEQAARLQSVAGAFGDVASLMQSENKKLFAIGKAAAIAEATVSGYEAATEAWAKGMKIGGPPVAAAFTAASLARTGALISSIASTNIGSSGGGGAVGGGAPSAPNYSQAVAITLEGSESATFTKSQVRDLINQINEAVEGGAIVRLA